VTWRATAGMAAVLVALLVVGWALERWPAAPDEAPPLLAAPERAARIAWTTPAAELVVVRADEGWRDARGRAVDAGVVRDLLDALGSLRPVLTIDAASDAGDDFGLGAGAGRLRVADAAGDALCDLVVGRRNPAGTGVYVQRAGAASVLVVGALLDWELAKLRQRDTTP